MNKRKIGNNGEDAAAGYLNAKGYTILKRNFFCRAGEIDIIARDKDTIVFAEVKYRTAADFGIPEEAVTIAKQERIYRAAEYYMYKSGMDMDLSCRFDVIAVEGKKIRHYENAFGGL